MIPRARNPVSWKNRGSLRVETRERVLTVANYGRRLARIVDYWPSDFPAALSPRRSSHYLTDVSRTGAQVKVAGAAPLPGVLHLVELNKGVAYEAEVVWREFPRFGLKYLKAHDLAHDAVPERKVLRQVWQEHLAR